MKLRTLVWRELFERKSQMFTTFLAILLGITTVVAITNVTHYSEKAVAREMDALGANVLILPKSVTLQDYYSADIHNEVMSEDYVAMVLNAGIDGVDNLSPKLCVPVELPEKKSTKKFTLTGILPKREFPAKGIWATGTDIFSLPVGGCGTIEDPTATPTAEDKKALSRNRVIEDLGSHETLLGADVAAFLKTKKGNTLSLLGESFTVAEVLEPTGTVDDSRIFANLHTVQRLANKEGKLSVIEIVGCCEEISKGMVAKLNETLPDAKVVTVTQVVATQTKINDMMGKLSLIFLVIIVVVGGAGIANYMYANVFERRREIGTLMALGAESGLVLRVFLLKAWLLGLVGGIGGFGMGTILAMILGPKLAGVAVLPMPILAVWAIGLSVGIATVASYFPARRAARLDPCATFQEV
ncbi:MAG TPA: FtsX-like permease family protein [Thermoguttaceae bacterium]|nr:FtsX-like permease family protein [Thermoguttaceae bacterium]